MGLPTSRLTTSITCTSARWCPRWRLAHGWTMNTDSMGRYGNFYLKRAIVSMIGLGANAPEDAIYPLQVVDANGQPATGATRHILHFPAGQLPPVDAFWSVTLYDGEGFQIPNASTGSRSGTATPSSTTPTDRSPSTSRRAPADDARANWLPAPTGPFSLCMRLYAPRPEALDGLWNPPALARRLDPAAALERGSPSERQRGTRRAR